jgi:hypothetical protein
MAPSILVLCTTTQQASPSGQSAASSQVVEVCGPSEHWMDTD